MVSPLCEGRPQIFYLVPVLGILFNIFPVNNSLYFAIAFTVYIFMIQARPRHVNTANPAP